MVRKLAQQAVGAGLRTRRISAKRGFQLMSDPGVPVGRKWLAWGIGVAVTGILIIAEFPLETLFAVALPLLGEGIDLLANGLEAFLAPPLIAALALSAMIRDA